MKDWEQQEGEPDRWYSRFHSYLLMGSNRSLLGFFNSEMEGKGGGKKDSIPSSWEKIVKKWDWKNRATQWDRHNQKADLESWESRRIQQREEEWQASKRLLERALEMLNQPLNDRKWSYSDAAKLIEASSKLARQSAEMWGGDLSAAIEILMQYGYQVIDKYADNRSGDTPEEQ